MNSTHIKRGALAALTMFLGVAAAGSAVASETAGALYVKRSITIDYSDLDLTQPQGVNALYSRVVSAARRACSDPQPMELARFAEFRKCVDRAVSEAVGDVNQPALAAVHRAKKSRSAMS
jgi:UrcA family protein